MNIPLQIQYDIKGKLKTSTENSMFSIYFPQKINLHEQKYKIQSSRTSQTSSSEHFPKLVIFLYPEYDFDLFTM